MQKLKNRKRLTALAIAFMLVFMTGAAFAFSPGALDVVGTVNIAAPDELYVVWETADTGTSLGGIQPWGFSWGVIDSTATIGNARGRTDQRITWTITFEAPDEGWDIFVGNAEAALTATATNNSVSTDALISAATVTWSPANAPTLFGFDLDIDQAAFTGVLDAGDATGDLVILLDWDGTFPAGFFDGETPGDPVFAATLTIEFEYDPV